MGVHGRDNVAVFETPVVVVETFHKTDIYRDRSWE